MVFHDKKYNNMLNTNWEQISNSEIHMKLQSMEMEYENIKNKINILLDKLDSLDKEYIKGKKELKKRVNNEK
jgi:hypothetical protein